ncbi:MAG: tetratricopeptide repeat protein [Rhodospirillales bacterium]|nr:tetratricopeptide repeat protein [Rhodospirillales bacterium]MCB9994966.1 tetratricopeptide repeat protein [Rhodospirillales bacterium]
MSDTSSAVKPIMDILSGFGGRDDADIDPAEAALWLAALGHPGITLERYSNHLQKLVDEVRERHGALLAAGADESAETQLAALKHIIADKHGYSGDHEDPDHIQNADMIRVIDRGKGNPVSLSLLYIHVARALGWTIWGLDFPGYFALRLDDKGQRLLFDPFERCGLLQAADLRRIIKKALGAHAELSTEYYEPVTNRDMLIRLQNHVKFRQIETEDYEAALQSVEAMRALDPSEYRLLLDAGVLYARTDKAGAAILALEDYLRQAPPGRDRDEAAYLLEDIRHMTDDD